MCAARIEQVPGAMSAVQRMLLIADADRMTIVLLRAAALRRGFRVLVARNGAAVVRLAIEHRPDLVLVDLDQPGLGGIAISRALEELPATHDIPVVIRAGRALGSQTIREAISAGVIDCVEKRCPLEHLFHHLGKLIDPVSSAPATPFPWSSMAIDELTTMPLRAVRGRAPAPQPEPWPDVTSLGCSVEL
jgi:CheY-like chemotaxis protein